ncbi:MAG: LeuA family protein [Vicinamibacterales bacterium]
MLSLHPLVHDWNGDRVDGPRPVMLNDETLRDGLQSPSVRTPSIDDKLDLLRRMDALGIDTANIGLPGAGARVASDVEHLAQTIGRERLRITANCAARTLASDIQPIASIAQRTGVPIECCAFIGSSPLRQIVEGWSLDYLQRTTEEAIGFAVKEGLTVTYVTEDTTRANPESLQALFTTAIRAGASRICIADTVGYATPAGARALVMFVKSLLAELGVQAGIDWHGHQDRGLAVATTLAALEAGATRLHGTALGIGERSGNTPIDQLLVNLVMMGYIDRDLTSLPAYCAAVARACDVPIPVNCPVVGADAFRTATGVHAAAVVKAARRNDRALMDAVYAAVPASLVGRFQRIEIGPMSGRSNVVYWLESRGMIANEVVVERILSIAKAGRRTLTASEVQGILEETPVEPAV